MINRIQSRVGLKTWTEYGQFLTYAEGRFRRSALVVQITACLAWGVAAVVAPADAHLDWGLLLLYGLMILAAAFLTDRGASAVVRAIGRATFALVIANALAHVVHASPNALYWVLAIASLVVVAMSPLHHEPLAFLVCASLIDATLLWPRRLAILQSPEWAWMACLVVFALVFGLLLNSLYFLERLRLYQTNRRLAELAYRDGLTQLNNRRAFMTQLERAVVSAEAHELHFLLVDVDDFKCVNDRHGHAMGDQVLRSVAARIRAIAGDAACARIGGEEFAVLSRGGRAQAEALAVRINAAFTDRPIEHLWVTVSTGVSCFRPGMTVGQLMNEADLALYDVKKMGKNGYSFAA